MTKVDGTVWASGYNYYGQLGDGTTINRLRPVRVKGPGGVGFLVGLAAINANWGHTLALKADGTVWAWGANYYGNLGDGTNAWSSTPIQVKGPGGLGTLADVVAIRGGLWWHSVALKVDGTVWAWGQNTGGQLGDGTVTPRSTPVQVKGPGGVGFLDTVAAVSAGGAHTLAVKIDHTVWAWGLNHFGQLGDGTSTARLTPVQVKGPGGVGILGSVVAVAGAVDHTLALKSDGTVWAWGQNVWGQLGDGTTTDSLTPVQVQGPGGTGFLTGVIGIAATWYHNLALKADGTVWAWGRNLTGQLGDGTTTDRLTPVQVQGLAGVTAVATGDAHSLAVVSLLGTLWTWGDNSFGQLGDGSDPAGRATPGQVPGFGSSRYCPPD